MVRDRAGSIRLAAFVNMALGALAIASISLANNKLAALWSAGFVGAGLLLWGAIDAWAAWGSHLRGTKLLAMFMAILGIVLAGTAWFVDTSALYRVAASLLGALIFCVSVVDAIISPDEKRRASFEPRRVDDLGRPPAHP